MQFANPQDIALKPSDLRGILKYVPQFRGHTFVIALDGSLFTHENFSHLLLDIAVLRSLNIKIVLTHGISHQLQQTASERNFVPSNSTGEGPTDGITLPVAVEVCSAVTQQLMQGLSQAGLQYAVCNAVRSTEVGVSKGVDQGHTGKIDRIDGELLNQLMDRGILPIVQPVAYNRDGQPLRVNSDLMASALSLSLKSNKLIFLTSRPGLTLNGELSVNLPVEALRDAMRKNSDAVEPALHSKAQFAIQALEGGTERVHILDGRIFGGLLTEIFDKVGIGTMIHSNAYQQIRLARKKDIPSILTITKNAIRTEALRHRTRQSLEKDIETFFVYEIDDSLIACTNLVRYPDPEVLELATVYVQPFYQGRGVGKRMVEFALQEAVRQGAKKIFALTTTSRPFFVDVCGFREGSLEDLPTERRELYLKEARNSKILVREF